MAFDDNSNAWMERFLQHAVPQDPIRHLEPESSPLSRSATWMLEHAAAKYLLEPGWAEVESIARELLHPEIASVLCLPSWSISWSLWIVGEKRYGYSIISTEPNFDWSEINPASPESDIQLSPPEIPIKLLRSDLASELGAPICNVWKKISSQTRYPKVPILGACDGVTYHFGYEGRGINPMGGQTWSPARQTAPGELAACSHTLRDFLREAETSKPQLLQDIKAHLVWFQTHENEL
jgi:hypothetical protein